MPRPKSLPTFILAALVATTCARAAEPGFRMERELALEPGARFVLETDSGSVRVQGTDRAGARILLTAARDDVEERYTLRFEQTADGAAVKVERRGGVTRWMFPGGDRLRFEIELPRRVELDLSTAGGSVEVREIEGAVNASTSGGAIDARELTGDVRLATSGGSIDVERVAGGLIAKTSGGPIDVAGVSGDARLETSGGSIEVADAGGRIEARTSGGPVRARFAPGNASGGVLRSSGGGITVFVDPGVGLDIDAASSGGRVTVDLPVTIRGPQSRTAVRGSLNGGGAPLEIRTSGGSIRLRGL